MTSPAPGTRDPLPDVAVPTPPRERRGLSGCAVAGIVFGILAVAVLAGGLWLARSMVDQMKTRQARFTCLGNLGELAALWVTQPPATPPRSGPAVFLEWRKRGVIERMGERVLLCPVDPEAVVRDTPEWRSRWDDVDLDDPGRGLCSYAVRNFREFPVTKDADPPVPIAACLHHVETAVERGGAVVAYSDGTVSWLGFEELGISSGAELVAGPQSKSPLLRELVAPPARARRR